MKKLRITLKQSKAGGMWYGIIQLAVQKNSTIDIAGIDETWYVYHIAPINQECFKAMLSELYFDYKGKEFDSEVYEQVIDL